MRIAAVPAHRNRAVNHNSMLYTAVAEAGVAVEEFGLGSLFGPSPQVVHIHWPEWLFSARPRWRARLQAALFRRMVTNLRQRGTRLVWTVHNLDSHHAWHPDHEAREWAWFVQHIDGWISLSHGGVCTVIERYPHLASVPHQIIPHGHYRRVYPNVVHKSEVQNALGIPEDTRVIAAIGELQPYKQIPMLARTFSQLRGDDLRLVIAGKAKREVQAEIEAINDERIIFRPGFVADEDLQIYHRAADLVVLPYSNILNSGSAILSLSFDTPVLVPRLGAMGELAKDIGLDWVQTYGGELTPQILERALERRPKHGEPCLDSLAWGAIGTQTAEFYNEVCSANRRPSCISSAAPAMS